MVCWYLQGNRIIPGLQLRVPNSELGQTIARIVSPLFSKNANPGLRPLTDRGVFDMLFKDGPLCKNMADVCPRGRASVNWVSSTVHASFCRSNGIV